MLVHFDDRAIRQEAMVKSQAMESEISCDQKLNISLTII